MSSLLSKLTPTWAPPSRRAEAASRPPIVMLLAGVDAGRADELLAAAGGFVRQAVELSAKG